MVFGPKQAIAIEKRKNPQAFESTIQGLMKTMKLSRANAEKVSFVNLRRSGNSFLIERERMFNV
jgi:hypothetical protein